MSRWAGGPAGPDGWHVWPLDDLREHMIDEPGEFPGCWCLPVWEPVATNDGNICVLVSHNSLDGREVLERLAEDDGPRD